MKLKLISQAISFTHYPDKGSDLLSLDSFAMVAKQQRRKSIKINLRVPLNVPVTTTSSSSRGERRMGTRSMSTRSMGSSNNSLSATELVFDPLGKDAAELVVDHQGASTSTLDSAGFVRPSRQGRRASLDAQNSSVGHSSSLTCKIVPTS